MQWCSSVVCHTGEFVLSITRGCVAFHGVSTAEIPWLTSDYVHSRGGWGDFVHIAGTFDGKISRVYVNGSSSFLIDILNTLSLGALCAEGERKVQSQSDSHTPVLIGAQRVKGEPQAFFKGIIAEV